MCFQLSLFTTRTSNLVALGRPSSFLSSHPLLLWFATSLARGNLGDGDSGGSEKKQNYYDRNREEIGTHNSKQSKMLKTKIISRRSPFSSRRMADPDEAAISTRIVSNTMVHASALSLFTHKTKRSVFMGTRWFGGSPRVRRKHGAALFRHRRQN